MTRRTMLGVRALVASNLASAVLAGTAAAAPLPARIELPDGWAPEGITSGRGTTFYVGSLADGAIWRGDLRTGDGSILAAGASGRVAVGIDYEPGADRLWVAGGDTGTVRAYDASSGALLATYTFAAGTTGFLNDVAVTRDAVYVTDSGIQQLVVVPLGRGGTLPPQSAVHLLPLTGDLVFGPGFNANGIVAARGWLIVVQTSTGQLFRVDPATGETDSIDLGDGSATFGDGLEVRGGALYVVRNELNRIAVFRLGPQLLSATPRGEIASDDLDVPTTATYAAGRLWAVNARFGTDVTPTTDYWVTRLPSRP